MVFISPEANASLYKSQLRAGDVVTVRTGYPGTSAVVPRSLDGANAIDILITTPKPQINSTFLAAWINSPFGRTQVLRDQGGLAQQHFNVGDMKNLLVAMPVTKNEQDLIGLALDDSDALIGSLEQLLAKKRRIKQGAMQELLTGKRRLPGFHGRWSESVFAQLGSCLRGVTYDPVRDLSETESSLTVRLLRSNNVKDALIVFEDMQFVHHARVSDAQILRRNDLLICTANGSRDLVGKAGKFKSPDGVAYTFGAFMGCFRPNESACDADFVFYVFQTKEFRDQIRIQLAGSSINNLSPSAIEGFAAKVPEDKSEQVAIAKVLVDMDDEIAAVNSKLIEMQQIKQGMMQELLTGRIRLV